MPDGREGEARRREGARFARSTSRRRGALPTALAIGERGRTPQPSFFLHRGSPDSPGSQMTPGVLSVASEREWTFPEPPAGREVELAPPRLRRVAACEGQSADRARDGQPPLAAPLRRGHRPHAQQLRQDGRAAVASGAARLARARVHRPRLEPEGDARADADVARLSDGEPRHPGQRRRSIPRTGCSGARRACGSRPRSSATTILAVAGTLDRTRRRPVDLPVHRSRSLRGELTPQLARQAGRRSVDVAAQPLRVPRSAASAIRCSRRSISRTWSTPADRRNRTTIAPQALILMNNRMVLTQAGKFAERLKTEAGADVATPGRSRVPRWRWRGRPTRSSGTRSVAFVRAAGARPSSATRCST